MLMNVISASQRLSKSATSTTLFRHDALINNVYRYQSFNFCSSTNNNTNNNNNNNNNDHVKLKVPRVKYTNLLKYYHNYNKLVYSWGSGSNGKLGLRNDVTQLIKPTLIEDLLYDNITNISCCTTCSLFATDKSRLYGCGNNAYGQLIIGNGKIPLLETIQPIDEEFHKTIADSGKRLVQLTSGTYHNGAVYDDGTAYLWGSGNSGQVGAAKYARLQFQPLLNTKLSNLGTKQLALGSTFSLALTNDGDIYSFGSAMFNELGHDSEFTERVPKKIVTNYKFTAISAGYFHGIALTTGNKVVVWGRNQEGQCKPVESGMEKGCFSGLFELDLSGVNGKVIHIRSGSFSNYILTDSGNMYSIGSNSHGQLGVGDDFKFGELNHIKSIENIQMFWTGHQYVIAKDSQGRYYGWGSNYDFQLANEKRCVYNMPILLDNLSSIGNIEEIAASVTHY
ncbi:hypothetical protein PPL_08844 [Heterostelium album PN500]|uniref:RCC1-like domain-containing protein n=1 Tax=Heterostelium pallidum (strain ATCC 26659 / Pp 5 / PN500) TaxID=670386 RepID=D3BJW4_HETP5|nr:hypothetical protein PPL_08844 [Heterostelium album PN500]EFA78194.1 hypothetical protein PPL_08844 [Heterostelium album PN500]|eukprot:XP_020430320.1 hypothetical protein PPL_08844 [Heterostelium album PN500]